MSAKAGSLQKKTAARMVSGNDFEIPGGRLGSLAPQSPCRKLSLTPLLLDTIVACAFPTDDEARCSNKQLFLFE